MVKHQAQYNTFNLLSELLRITERQENMSTAEKHEPDNSEENKMPSDIKNTSETFTLAKDLRIMIREQIQHEDDLVNHRVNWLLLLQGFLVVAFVQVLTNKNQSVYQFVILVCIAIFGIVIGLFVLSSIRGAIKAIEELEDFWKTTDAIKVEDRAKLPPISYQGKLDGAEVAAYGIPALVMIVWLTLLIVVFVT